MSERLCLERFCGRFTHHTLEVAVFDNYAAHPLDDDFKTVDPILDLDGARLIGRRTTNAARSMKAFRLPCLVFCAAGYLPART